MNGGYQVEYPTKEEQAAADPFAGRGLFLPMDARGDVALAALEEAARGIVPACALNGRGVWVDAGSPAVNREQLLKAWEERNNHAQSSI
jgi:hypothetical protein